jgi:hypothetical protein
MRRIGPSSAYRLHELHDANLDKVLGVLAKRFA